MSNLEEGWGGEWRGVNGLWGWKDARQSRDKQYIKKISIKVEHLFFRFKEDKQFKEEKGLVLNTLANLVEPKGKGQEVKEAAAAKTVKARGDRGGQWRYS